MPSAKQRELLAQILVLIAELEMEPTDTAFGARRAAARIREGKDLEAIETLRKSASGIIASTGQLIESYLD